MAAQNKPRLNVKLQFSVNNNVKWRCKLSNNVLPNSKPKLNVKRQCKRNNNVLLNNKPRLNAKRLNPSPETTNVRRNKLR